MSFDLDFDAGQRALGDAVRQFCADHWSDADSRAPGSGFSRELWRGLADLGVLGAGAPGEEGGAVEVCAIMEALGHAVFPGPLAASYLAQQVLPEDEAAGVAAGETVVSAGSPPLLPWAAQANLFLVWEDDAVFRAEAAGAVQAQDSPGGEAWGRVELRRGERLSGGLRGLALGEIARAAYLTAAGRRLLGDAAEHALQRRQFGRPIGEFQGVAHPLADSHMRLEAARALARAAACAFDAGEAREFRHRAASARLSSTRAALEAVHVGHQVFGAVGITLEGPAHHISRRIRSLAVQPPGPEWARENHCMELGLVHNG